MEETPLERIETKRVEEALHDPALFLHVPVPMVSGIAMENEVVIEQVNRAFIDQWGAPKVPCEPRGLFTGVDGPVWPRTFLECALAPGRHRRIWEVIPGELVIDLALFRNPDGRFIAFLLDCTDRMIVRRMSELREQVQFLLQVHNVREVLPSLARSIAQPLGIDWAGILLWSAHEERWTLLAGEANLRSQDVFDRVLSFLDDLKAKDAATGIALGGLVVEEGAQWLARWGTEAGAWKETMQKNSFNSLFAATLLTGALPMVFLCLSGRDGALARINGEVVRSLWPTLTSTAERYRVVVGASALSERDPVTGLPAAGALRRSLEQECVRARRYKYSLSLLRVRLRNASAFRARGVEMFDEAMRHLAREGTRGIRTADVIGRLDGESFLLILPHTPSHGSQVVYERLKERVQNVSPVPGKPLEVDFQMLNFDAGEMPDPAEAIARLCELSGVPA